MPELRTKEFDHDTRTRSATDFFCAKCQRSLKPEQPRRMVHLINGGSTILHPEDESLYTPDAGDCGSFPVGMDCAKQIGLEWTFPVPA